MITGVHICDKGCQKVPRVGANANPPPQKADRPDPRGEKIQVKWQTLHNNIYWRERRWKIN